MSCASESSLPPASPAATARAIALTATLPSATPAPPPRTPTTASSPTPAPTGDAAYDSFGHRLKAAIETDDEAALRQLMVPNWLFGKYRGGPLLTQSVDEALDRFRAARPKRPGASYAVDLMRVAWNAFNSPGWTSPDRRMLVARWQDEGGRDVFDELHTQRIDDQWRWTGLTVGSTFYHSPPLSVFRANPWAILDMLLVGEYRGKNVGNDIPEQGTDEGRDKTFVLKDFSGTAIWVRYYTDVVTLPFQPDEPANIGRQLLVFAQAMVQKGFPAYVHAHSVSQVTADDYLAVTGTVQAISADQRSLTLLAPGGRAHRVMLLETTNIDRTDGCPAPLTALRTGSRIAALGRPAPGNAILAEQIYVLPMTGPDWTPTNHIQVFFDGNLFHRHDLRANTVTTFPNRTKLKCG